MPTTIKVLTQEEVRQHLDYDPETGELRWRVRRGGRRVGRPAGAARKTHSRIVIGINGKKYLAHRIIWLWVYGYFPENVIDHIDRDPSNNKLSNLREVSQLCNMRNSKIDKRNKTGVTGVFWDEKNGKWLSNIRLADKTKYLAYCSDFTEAVAHRLAAEQCLDWAGCDSNSSAYQYMKRVGVI